MVVRRVPVVILFASMILLCAIGINGDETASQSSPSSLAAANYWKKVLSNTPMPETIKDSLFRSDSNKNFYFAVRHPLHITAASEADLHDPTNELFFLQKNLQPGSKLTLQFTQSPGSSKGSAVPFLSRSEAASISLSSENVAAILDRFSISTPGSEEANAIKQSIEECEKKMGAGIEKYCATSLESMVDFATDKLGNKNVKALGTEVKGVAGLQDYTVVGTHKVKGSTGENVMVACHRESAPFSMYFCHKTPHTVGYKVSLVGANGATVEAAAACHQDTSAWNPKHLAFQMFKVKPGTVPICHFISKDNLIWV